jgi:hypothetical protein
MTALDIKVQLKKWGIPFKEYKDWKEHNRNTGRKWGPVNGLMVHHTGSDSSDQRELLYAGRSDLPGPLAQMGLDQDGVIHLIGWGRANHAGLGDPDVLNAVIAESYATNPPACNQASVDGNARFYGVEICYTGSHDMTDEQRATLELLGAAICDYHSWTSKSIIGHGEWQPGKWDPGYKTGKMMTMSTLRNAVTAVLKKGPVTIKPPVSTTPPPVTVPTKPATPTKPSIPMKSATYKAVWDLDAATPPDGHTTPTNPYWAPMSFLRGIYEMVERIKKNTDEILRLLNNK